MDILKPAWLQELVGGASQRASASGGAGSAAGNEPAALVHVVFATETGVAEDLAHDTCGWLEAAGLPFRLLQLDDVTLKDLQGMRRVLFLVSTTGLGDPPDMAWEFHERHMVQPAALGNLAYGLLALGDSSYPDFRAFGRALDGWLHESGASRLFDRVDLDDEDDAGLALWKKQVETFATRLAQAGSAA